jgi:hypothetical protein
MMGYTEALLAHTFQLLTCNAVHPVEARCCRWLLMLRHQLQQDTPSISPTSSWLRC